MKNDIGERAYLWFRRHSTEMTKSGGRWREAETSGDDAAVGEAERLFYIHMKACDTFRGMFARKFRRWVPSECPECGSPDHDMCLMVGETQIAHAEVLRFLEECQVRASDPFTETATKIAMCLIEIRPIVSRLAESLEECQKNFEDLADSIQIKKGDLH